MVDQELFGATVPLDISEDCLFLEVYTPSLQGRRAVMVWIYGGGLSAGKYCVTVIFAVI